MAALFQKQEKFVGTIRVAPTEGYVVHYLQLDGQNETTTQTCIHM